MTTAPADKIRDNAAQNRYEMDVDGEIAFVTYSRTPSGEALLHAEVPRRLEGRGIGGRLVRAVLDHIRPTGAKVIPRCSFVAAYIKRHPEVQDLLASPGSRL